jgi:glycosyltransferase involved in cell wall biosynthesis
VCTRSDYATRAWIRASDLAVSRCSSIGEGVDPGRFRPEPNRRPRSREDAFSLVSIGRLVPSQGYTYLLGALNLMKDPRFRLTILGEGPARTSLETLAVRFRMAELVSLPGRVADPEDYLRTADAFVLPSVDPEASPSVLAEAMASGLPLVTSDFPPLTEVNIDGLTGTVVPAGTVAPLADALLRLADDPELCVRTGRANCDRARESFPLERMVREHVELYERLAAERRKPEPQPEPEPAPEEESAESGARDDGEPPPGENAEGEEPQA